MANCRTTGCSCTSEKEKGEGGWVGGTVWCGWDSVVCQLWKRGFKVWASGMEACMANCRTMGCSCTSKEGKRRGRGIEGGRSGEGQEVLLLHISPHFPTLVPSRTSKQLDTLMDKVHGMRFCSSILPPPVNTNAA